MENTLVVGAVVKAQGIKGELKIKPFTDDINRFKKLKSVLIDGQNYKVAGAKIAVDFVILALDGITDRNTAETFRGKLLHVSRENAVKPQKGSYFIADIIGCAVQTDDGNQVGKVVDVTKANTDIWTVNTTDNRVLRFPFLKDLVKDIDIENKLIVLFAKRLGEVSCYED